MPQVHIVLCGEAHNESAAYYLVLHAIQKLASQGFKIAVGAERNANLSLSDCKQSNIEDMQTLENYIRLLVLADRKNGKLTADDKALFYQSCPKSKLPLFIPENLQSFVDGAFDFHKNILAGLLHNLPSSKQSFELFSFLSANEDQIPFYALDHPAANDLMANLKEDIFRLPSKDLKSLIDMREQFMAEKIFHAIQPLFSTGGFFFAFGVGLAHIKALVYYLNQKLEQFPQREFVTITPLHFCNRTIGIEKSLAAYLDSIIPPSESRLRERPLVRKLIEIAKIGELTQCEGRETEIKATLLHRENLESPDMQALYNLISIRKLYCEPTSDAPTLEYDCPEFDAIIRRLAISLPPHFPVGPTRLPKRVAAAAGAPERGSFREPATCAHCKNQNPPKKCGKCHTIEYCSADCQIKDWKRHKLNCPALFSDLRQGRSASPAAEVNQGLDSLPAGFTAPKVPPLPIPPTASYPSSPIYPPAHPPMPEPFISLPSCLLL